MYVTTNFKTKKALKEAVAQGIKVSVWQPNGDIFSYTVGDNTRTTATVEGPHYPEPHRWYAEVELKDGYITKVR